MAGVWKESLCLAHTPTYTPTGAPLQALLFQCVFDTSDLSEAQFWNVVLVRVYWFRMLAHTSYLWNVWGKSARQTWHMVFWSVSVFGNQRLLRERRVGPGLFFPVRLQHGQADHHGVLNQNEHPRRSTVENMVLNDGVLRIKYHAIKSSFTEILIGLNIIIIVNMYTHTHTHTQPILPYKLWHIRKILHD